MQSRDGFSPFIGENEILRILYQHNPWWQKKPISGIKLKPFKRRDFFKILERLEDNKILALIGPRQVGKTTLVYQLIAELLGKIPPERILFVSLDDPFLSATVKNLGKLFELYSATILKEPLDDLEKRVFIFLDEIQYVKNWEVALKRWYDLGYDMKFIVTGSSSLSIRDSASESLVGRISPQIVFPMKFLEYVRFKEERITDSMRQINKVMRESLKNALLQNKVDEFYKALDEQVKILLPFRDRILVHLNQYFIKGGYPELMNKDDLVAASQYLKDYLHLTLYRDIVRTRGIRDPIALENLFTILAKNSSELVVRETLGKQLSLKRDTLNTYIYLLQSAFLISEVEYFSESAHKRARRERKIFINDIGVRNVSASIFDEQILANYTEMGRVVETVVADHTRRLRFNLEATPFPPLFYWREENEVDFVINPFNKTLPIEVKYREDIDKADLTGLNNFMKKFKPPMSLVITKNHMKQEGSIIYLPAWLYLLIC